MPNAWQGELGTPFGSLTFPTKFRGFKKIVSWWSGLFFVNYYFYFNVFVFCEIEIIMEQDDNAPRHLKQFFFDERNVIRNLDHLFCKARKLKVYTKIDECSDFSIHFILFKTSFILIRRWAYEFSLSLARSLKNTPDQITVDLQ